ncbi:hypothetical protein AB0M36_18600 [Actinoplanes sp. NPDC051346]|uniref:hypothetical protein n=1 Tax=Actinoplanes sp. NPDC051346 TaxID=3155048 RepID=UPI00344A87AB
MVALASSPLNADELATTLTWTLDRTAAAPNHAADNPHLGRSRRAAPRSPPAAAPPPRWLEVIRGWRFVTLPASGELRWPLGKCSCLVEARGQAGG